MKIEPSHDFFKPDWKEGYTRRPRREKENTLRVSGGTARKNFTAHSGAYAGNKTWSVSVMAKVVSGAKNKGYPAAFAKYIDDPKKSLSCYGDEGAAKKFGELEEKLLSQDPRRVTQRQLIIPMPTEFLNKADINMEKLGKQLEKKYFDVCYTWNMVLHDGGSDFKNPHIHVIFSPVDANLKNIRDFSKQNEGFLESLKKDVRDFITQELGIKAELKEYKKNKEKGGIKHYPKWVANALKRAEAAETAGDAGKMFKEYAQRYQIFAEYAEERKRKKIEKNIADLDMVEAEKIKEIKQKAGKIINKDKSMRDYFIKNKNEIDAEAAQAEARVKAKYQTLHPEPKINPDRPENLQPEPEDQKTDQKTHGQEKALKPENQIYFKQYQTLTAENLQWEKIDKDKKLAFLSERVKAFKMEFPSAKFDKEKRAWALDANIPDIEERLKNFTTEDVKAVQAVIVEEQAEQKPEPLTPGKDKEIVRDAFAEDLERRLNKSRGKGFGR